MSWGRTFCVVTGASRGIGQQIAIKFAKKMESESVILLVARSEAGLNQTKKLIDDTTPNLHVKAASINLQSAGAHEYKGMIEGRFQKLSKSASDYQRVILVHNAADYHRELVLDLDDEEDVQKDVALNFISPIILNTQFFKIFDKSIPNRTVVQITSGVSLMATPYCGMYGAIKVARNYLFLTLAVEDPSLRVLTFEPGAVETDMLRRTIAAGGLTMEDTKKKFASIGFPVIQPDEVADCLVNCLETNFKSGSYVQVYNFIKKK